MFPLPEGKIVFDRIAVVPFQQVAPEESLERGRSLSPLRDDLQRHGDHRETRKGCWRRFSWSNWRKTRPKFNVIAGERVAGVYRRISADSLTTPLRQVLRDVGSELGAEGVVAGYVYRFRERKGVSYTVEQPASVAFEIHLLRVSDGALVWRGTFDKTQSSLMENLFSFPRFFGERGSGSRRRN